MTPRQSRTNLVAQYDEATRRAVRSLIQKFPDVAAVMIQGSVARGEHGPFSDIDVMGVTHGRKHPEFSYFDGEIYVSVGFLTVAYLSREFKDPKQFFWARGSALSSTRIVYDPKGILRRTMLRWRRAEPSDHLLESALGDEYHHIIEYSGKLRNGWLRRDEYLTRYAARVIAQHVENAIIVLNDLSPISENHVWKQVLKAKKVPRHLGIDYPIALGLEGTRDTRSVYRSAMRLCSETIRLIREEFEEKAIQANFRKLLAEHLEKHGL